MNKALVYPSAFLLLAAIWTGCGPQSESGDSATGGGPAPSPAGSDMKLAFVSNGVASFWTIAQKGVEKAGEDLGVPVSVHMPAEGITDQKRMIEDLVTKGNSNNPRRVGLYGAGDRILLVGEGNFTFAASLCSALGGANIVATSLDSKLPQVASRTEAVGKGFPKAPYGQRR